MTQKPKWLGWRAIVLIAAVLVVINGPFRFGYFSVCRECGAVRKTIERQVPLTRLSYWTTHTIEETYLSSAVGRLGLLGAHQHDWLFGAGGGNGVVCALGDGRQIRTNAELYTIARFVENVSESEGEEAARKWLAYALDPKNGHGLRYALSSSRYPPTGCRSPEEYRKWKEQGEKEFSAALDSSPGSCTDR